MSKRAFCIVNIDTCLRACIYFYIINVSLRSKKNNIKNFKFSTRLCSISVYHLDGMTIVDEITVLVKNYLKNSRSILSFFIITI